MGRKGSLPGKKPTKKKEIYFNFNKMRRMLRSNEKVKLVQFFLGFKSVFKELQGNLFKLNQKFDVMEMQITKFHQNYLKEINDEVDNNNNYDIMTKEGVNKGNEDNFELKEEEIAELFGKDK